MNILRNSADRDRELSPQKKDQDLSPTNYHPLMVVKVIMITGIGSSLAFSELTPIISLLSL